MTLAREIRTNTGYKRTNNEAHALMRQAFARSGDIDPTVPGILTISLDPLPTKAKTTATAELCQHLTATQTRYPGTDLILKYAVKSKAPAPRHQIAISGVVNPAAASLTRAAPTRTNCTADSRRRSSGSASHTHHNLT